MGFEAMRVGVMGDVFGSNVGGDMERRGLYIGDL